ncbi:hypothetical protein CERZMDRAFT_81182 [Cercospora zeae-maydis SCOH1-5]|uniref:Uncharacterized protein n=1 Tax=Cercospora zeae-maydis SCOH1-5 TaxID=717836 RepID=A0A6A6FV79_9PEZI|nr:hypothetical protein CERZMDRAFT_81182 [Cercospora zeae-maydis SCOH1-5]
MSLYVQSSIYEAPFNSCSRSNPARSQFNTSPIPNVASSPSIPANKFPQSTSKFAITFSPSSGHELGSFNKSCNTGSVLFPTDLRNSPRAQVTMGRNSPWPQEHQMSSWVHMRGTWVWSDEVVMLLGRAAECCEMMMLAPREESSASSGKAYVCAPANWLGNSHDRIAADEDLVGPAANIFLREPRTCYTNARHLDSHNQHRTCSLGHLADPIRNAMSSRTIETLDNLRTACSHEFPAGPLEFGDRQRKTVRLDLILTGERTTDLICEANQPNDITASLLHRHARPDWTWKVGTNEKEH